MANDPSLHLLGLARKAGRLEIDEEPVGAACRARLAAAAPTSVRPAAFYGWISRTAKRIWAFSWAAAPAPCWL